jgi:D-3-phosphoglycerate dehydrogenase / 2-oxoglutarate reductase
VKPKSKIVVTEPIADEPLAWLHQLCDVVNAPYSDHELLEQSLSDAHGLVVRTYTVVDQQLLERAPNLRVVGRAGVGIDNIDLHACSSRGIRVVHTPRANTQTVVEYVVSMMLTSLRPINLINNPASAHHEWDQLRARAITPRSCVGATLGIVGMGKIGSALACVARSLNMHVIYHDLVEIAQEFRSGAEPVTLETLARRSDVISIHVDGRQSNARSINEEFFCHLKEDVILINSSRGFVMDEPSAARFARQHTDATLILDVHDPEPISIDCEYAGLSNVICTPHIAAGTRDAKEQMSWVVRDVLRVIDNKEPRFPANTIVH